MSVRTEAFAPATVAHGHVERGSRDDSQEMQSSREPFQSDEVPADVHSPFTEPKPTEESTEDLVERLLVQGDACIDCLPSMAAPELRVVGRAVSFSAVKTVHGAKTRFFYTGLVTAVSATSATLMHVHRYTESDFEVYTRRERGLSKTAAAEAVELHGRTRPPTTTTTTAASSPHARGLVAHGYSADGEVGVGGGGQLTSEPDGVALRRMHAAGSLVAATSVHAEMPLEEAVFAAAALHEAAVAAETTAGTATTVPPRRPPLSTHDGSVGPLPCVTFLRKTMLDVKFARDPRSSFYALFQDPSKQLMDMQHLRMFVRRYLVHTSQGNNPDQVPLYAYVAARCGSRTLDRSLVYDLVREELPVLIETDQAIEKEKKQRQLREERRDARRGVVGLERTPTGLFAETGVLCHTGVPLHSFLTGLVLAVLTVITAVYLGISIGVLSDDFLTPFLLESLWFVVAALVVWVFASVTTVIHAFLMRVPLRQNAVLLVARAVFCAGGIGVAIMCMVVLIVHMSNETVYTYMTSQSSSDLCAFYQRHQCTGLDTSCFSWFADRGLCRWSCQLSYYDTKTCYSAVWTPIQIMFIPLIVLSAVNLLASSYSLMLVMKVILIARLVARRSF